jgi:beta-lysine 5,6-aminomutase alpha subunit
VKPVWDLELDQRLVEECRSLTASVAKVVTELSASFTTLSVERASLRLLGVRDRTQQETLSPALVNDVVDESLKQCGQHVGILLPFFDVLSRHEFPSPYEAALAIADRQLELRITSGQAREKAMEVGYRAATDGLSALTRIRDARRELRERQGDRGYPWTYVIVATGNILEDIRHARAAALGGADVIAVIRSTAQSLLDYVPTGATNEGFGGTYATAENFRLMRRALDEVGEKCGRYVRHTGFASGLCMPEMSVIAAHAGLDVMLNDSFYGIIFRDINPRRTFIDQMFSRRVHAFADIMIHTGEDAYIKIDDPVESAHTVFASNFINERLALNAGMAPAQIGLGRAAEIGPDINGQLSLEVANALLGKQLFPSSPSKWMPPTRHLDGDVFQAYLLQGTYNLVANLTQQDIVLLGMLSEGVHNPYVSDRELALRNAAYLRRACHSFADNFSLDSNGAIVRRAREVLVRCVEMLREVERIGLLGALHKGMFVGVKRDPLGGHGADGILEKGPEYFNPVEMILTE